MGDLKIGGAFLDDHTAGGVVAAADATRSAVLDEDVVDVDGGGAAHQDGEVADLLETDVADLEAADAVED